MIFWCIAATQRAKHSFVMSRLQLGCVLSFCALLCVVIIVTLNVFCFVVDLSHSLACVVLLRLFSFSSSVESSAHRAHCDVERRL